MISRRNLLAAIGMAPLFPAGSASAQAAGNAVFAKIRLVAGRVIVSGMVGTNGPYFFLLDSGGIFSFIDARLALALKMKRVGSRALQGVTGIGRFALFDAGDVTLGSGIRLPHMLFVGAGAPGAGLVGSFGGGLFTTFDCDLDFVRGEWRAYPQGRGSWDGMAPLPSRFSSAVEGASLPYADASVDGFSGSFALDTGSPGELMLDSQSTSRSGLWHDDRPYVPIETHGIGPGRTESRLIRCGRLTIGPFHFDAPLVEINKPGSPSIRGEGIIGLGAMRQLHVSTDVRRHRVWAAYNGLPAERSYPMSGLWVIEDKGRLRIDAVGTGSPAAAAGLRIGDTVVGTDLTALRARLNARAGSDAALTVERDGVRRDVVLRLVPYI